LATDRKLLLKELTGALYGTPMVSSRLTCLALVLCASSLFGSASLAGAEGTEPITGGWKGKTKQGFPIYLGVREGSAVTNVRITYRDAVCGKVSLKNRTLTMAVNEQGHFSGIVYPINGEVAIEGTFTGPSRLKGAIVAGESSGLPGCPGGRFPFTAHPKG
jgi:hypothetical protein